MKMAGIRHWRRVTRNMTKVTRDPAISRAVSETVNVALSRVNIKLEFQFKWYARWNRPSFLSKLAGYTAAGTAVFTRAVYPRVLVKLSLLRNRKFDLISQSGWIITTHLRRL